MFRWWAFWRRVQYGTLFLMVFGLLGLGLYAQYGYLPPTCSDDTMNGNERGVDCGGVCARICALDVIPPQVTWAESFKIIEGQYNAVAYVENKNPDIGTPDFEYTFKLYDDEGLIVQRHGSTYLPEDSLFPIFEGRVFTGSRIPTRTVLELKSDAGWFTAEANSASLSVVAYELTNADSAPRLTAELQNESLDEVRDVEVVATIFNAVGEPLTASRTRIATFPGRSTREILFTWPEPIVPACEDPEGACPDVSITVEIILKQEPRFITSP